MAGSDYILAIDQGTTSSRAIVFDKAGTIIAVAQQEFPQIYPHSGWVEHNPEDIWSSTLQVCREALAEAENKGAVVGAIGITNQRETTVLWDRTTGKAMYNAIVWQDRRTADFCQQLRTAGHAAAITAKTGLLIDPYFSATKLHWMLGNVPEAAARAGRGELAFGTVDSFLLWRLTRGKVHATDATNASRTMLFNIHDQQWDDDLLRLFRIPHGLLPEVKDCAADYGSTDPEWFGRPIPILGVAGDQHAAVIGQACFDPGMVKSTYGTGCFAVLNTGEKAVASQNRLLTTVAYRLNGKPTYALEGAIFIAGAAVQWLRDGLGLISKSAEVEQLVAKAAGDSGVYFVPAFTGLGAPYWDPAARGAIFGLTRDTGAADIARAALDAVCYQTDDLLNAMAADCGSRPSTLRVDGGMIANNWLLQRLADIAAIPVERPPVVETTALGAARLAGLQAGIYGSLDDMRNSWTAETRAEPRLEAEQRSRLIEGWKKAVLRVRENT